MPDAELPSDEGDRSMLEGDGIRRGRVRRTAPLAALTARTAGEAVVVGLRSRLTGADSTEFHVRTAEHAGHIYLDLADENWHAVDIGPDGWRLDIREPARTDPSDLGRTIAVPAYSCGFDRR